MAAVLEGVELTLPASVGDRLIEWGADPDDLELGVRPEGFSDAALLDAEPPAGQSFDARVMVVEPMGPHKDLAVRPLSREDDEDAEFTARIDNDTEASVGDTIRLTVDTDEIHLFDGKTGENLLVSHQ